MSHKVNLVRVLTSATGNSTPITLGAVYSQLFMLPSEAGAMDGRVYTYLIVDGNNWELGRGAYTASGTALARTTVIASRISGTLGTSRISLSGTAQVRFIESADDMDGVRGTRAVTGTSDTLNNSDLGYVVTYSNASAVAVSIAQPSVSNLFLDGWKAFVQNLGVGAVTITPASSTINGASTLVLPQNMGAMIWSNGTNYQAFFIPVTKPLLAANNLSDVVAATARSNLSVPVTGAFSATGDANSLTADGLYTVDPAVTNTPYSNYWYIQTCTHPVSGTYSLQIARNAIDSLLETWQRKKVAGTWGSWARVDAGASLSSAQQKQFRSNVGVDVTTLAKSANYTVVAADYGALIKLSSSATLALTAAATLGDGWKCDIRNTSTGVWVIDPNGSETVNGQATFNVYPGENFRLVCDGAGFYTVGTGTGLILMDTKVGSASATLDFTRSDTNRFYKYDFVFEGVFPSTAGSDVYTRVSTDGGSTFLTAGYSRTIIYSVSGTTLGTDSGVSLAQFPLVVGPGNDVGYAIVGKLSATLTGGWTHFEASHTSIDNTGTARRLIAEGGVVTSNANAFRFLCSAGNINGTIRQYGYSK